jgi:hypothetical protein
VLSASYLSQLTKPSTCGTVAPLEDPGGVQVLLEVRRDPIASDDCRPPPAGGTLGSRKNGRSSPTDAPAVRVVRPVASAPISPGFLAANALRGICEPLAVIVSLGTTDNG